MSRPDYETPNESGPSSAGKLGMLVFLFSLTMFFAASVVGYLVIRNLHKPWPPPGFPPLPKSLWLSTLAILASSVTIQRALNAARRGEPRAMMAGLIGTFAIGLAFLGLQTYAWFQVFQHAERLGAYLKMFYVLSGLHAAHVIGGLISLGAVVRRARAGVYGPSRHPGVLYSAMYWHFLDAVWCALFTVVYLL